MPDSEDTAGAQPQPLSLHTTAVEYMAAPDFLFYIDAGKDFKDAFSAELISAEKRYNAIVEYYKALPNGPAKDDMVRLFNEVDAILLLITTDIPKMVTNHACNRYYKTSRSTLQITYHGA